MSSDIRLDTQTGNEVRCDDATSACILINYKIQDLTPLVSDPNLEVQIYGK